MNAMEKAFEWWLSQMRAKLGPAVDDPQVKGLLHSGFWGAWGIWELEKVPAIYETFKAPRFIPKTD